MYMCKHMRSTVHKIYLTLYGIVLTVYIFVCVCGGGVTFIIRNILIILLRPYSISRSRVSCYLKSSVNPHCFYDVRLIGQCHDYVVLHQNR